MKSKTAAPKDKEHSLPREEYDFSRVQEDALEACCYYEYARESESIWRKVKYIRAELEASQGQKRLPEWCGGAAIDLLDHRHFAFARCNSFPDTPWQSLNKTDHEDMCGQLCEVEQLQELEMIPATGSSPIEKAMSLLEDRYLGPKARIGVYYIDTRHKQAHIVANFKKWLRGIYPKMGPGVRKGRQMSPRDSLNMLGALRLKCSCPTLNRAQELIKQVPYEGPSDEDRRMSYSRPRELTRACKRALVRFCFILHLPSDEVPRCYTQGWKK